MSDDVDRVNANAAREARKAIIWSEIQGIERDKRRVVAAAIKAKGVGDFQAQLDSLGERGAVLRREFYTLHGISAEPLLRGAL